MGSPEWNEDVTLFFAKEASKLLCFSSASVLGTQKQVPFPIKVVLGPCESRACCKLGCEQCVRTASDQANVVCVGWEIAPIRSSNDVDECLAQKPAEHEQIVARTKWFSDFSFWGDTAGRLAGALKPEGVPRSAFTFSVAECGGASGRRSL